MRADVDMIEEQIVDLDQRESNGVPGHARLEP